jgi:uncharacterized protein (TIGR02145 family)
MHAKTAENMFSGDYDSLENKPDLSIYSTTDTTLTEEAVDAMVADNGYITSDSVLSEEDVDEMVANNGYLTAEVDGDASNELQTLSISNDTIYLTDGSFVKLPAGFSGDYNDLSNTPDLSVYSTTDTTLTESEVDAMVANNGYLTSDSVLSEEAVDAMVANNGYLTSDELQTLSVSATGDTLYLSLGNYIIIPGISVANPPPPVLPTITIASVSSIAYSSAVSGGTIDTNGGAAITSSGVVWYTISNPTLESNTGVTAENATSGSFVSNITGLSSGTTYYVRAYATNSEGTAYSVEDTFTTTDAYPLGTVHCTGTPTEIVDVTNPTTGKTWMDRNLGASQVATSSTDADAYGDLYQWGRAADGHQCINSSTTATLSSTDEPGHGDFIIPVTWDWDWRSPQNDNLWQGVNGTNNPCPSGYRLPTLEEWEAEKATWVSDDAAGAFASPLKLPMAGIRNSSNGLLGGFGSNGVYWSSTVDSTSTGSSSKYSVYLYFGSSAFMSGDHRASGFSVRCLKD